MLIDFTVGNFRSIKEEQTLSLLATKLKEHSQNIILSDPEGKVNILSSCILYGANASGKSNIIKALDEFKAIILSSTDLKFEQNIPSHQPFKLDVSYKNKPTMFEMEFIPFQDNIRYRYVVEINQSHIKREELFFYPKKVEAVLFSRIHGQPIRFGNYLTGKKKNIEDELLDNNLFLSKAANSNNKQLQDIYRYFSKDFEIRIANSFNDIHWHSITPKLLHSDEHSFLHSKVVKLLTSLDTGITTLEVHKREMDETFQDIFSEDTPSVIKNVMEDSLTYRTQVGHRLYEDGKVIGNEFFDLREESDGTIKLYSIAAELFMVLLEGKIFIIDELDSSLHPHITAFILKLFNDPKINKNNAQLIIATHDASLLNPDQIRRDQVWFTNKSPNGATKLYSLVEFDKSEVRSTTPFNNWYLDGRFDAVPIINKSIYEIFKIDE